METVTATAVATSRHPHRARQQAAAAAPRQTMARAAQYSEFSEPVQALIAEVFANRAAFPILPEELPAVVAVRSVIADTVAQCPLVEMDEATLTRVPVQSALISRPDIHALPFQPHARMTWDLTGDGNAWLMPTVHDNRTGQVLAVKVLPSRDVTPIESGLGRDVLGCNWLGNRLSIAAGQVIHVPMHVTGRRGELGESPLRMSRPAMDAIAAMYRFAASTWSEFGAPSIKMKVPYKGVDQPADQGGTVAEQAAAIRSGWLDTHGGKRVPAVLFGGLDVEPFAMMEHPGELAEACDIISADAPRAYLVPPSITNSRTSSPMTYATVVDEMRRWIKIGLAGYFMRISAAYTSLLPAGRVARFDTSALTEGDVLALWQALTAAVGAPWLSTDEARSIAKTASPTVLGSSL